MDLVPPERIEAIAQAVDELPTDKAAFWTLFPHDILLDLSSD